ncbi:MAG: hypothetical protein ACO1PZ_17610 [Gammaproteobacteria bacterium]
MSIDGIVAWFAALPGLTQVFVGLFVLLMAIPIATLTVMQFFESLRMLRELAKAKRHRKDGDKGKE